MAKSKKKLADTQVDQAREANAPLMHDQSGFQASGEGAGLMGTGSEEGKSEVPESAARAEDSLSGSDEVNVAMDSGQQLESQGLEADLAEVDDIAISGQEEEAEQERQALRLEVQISEPSQCERHIVVTVPREDIERYFEREFDELVESASVPGFRPGRAPRRLVERRYRKTVAESVKFAVIFDAIEQVNEQYSLVPISEPKFDLDAIILPDEGPLTFEYDVEVRPQFEVPEWRGMPLELWKVDVTEEEIDREVRRRLESLGTLEPFPGPAEVGDYVVVDMKFRHGEEVIAESTGERIRIKRVLSFLDAEIANFDQLMVGVRPGEIRECLVQISPYATDVSLRGSTVQAQFTVREVYRLRIPELSPEVFGLLGVNSEEELRTWARAHLLAQKTYTARRHLRRQITNNLLKDAQWELPPGMLVRQTRRELRRTVLELQSLGMSREAINQLVPRLYRQALWETAETLREHFILERIAEELGLQVGESEVQETIRQLAQQEGISPRRLRARLEQAGSMDAVVNMVLESKVLNAIIQEANISEVPMPETVDEIERVRWSIGELPEELVTEVNTSEIESAEGV